MRDFFKHELGRLHLTTGLQQYSKLSDADYTELLDILCAECAKFKLIPDEAKEKIIQEAMASDAEFIGFNKRWIWKWLNVANRRYLPQPNEFIDYPTVEHTAEEQAKIDKILEEWKQQLQGPTAPSFAGIEQEMKQIQAEDKERQEGRKASQYKPWTKDDEDRREMHNRYIRENYRLIDGKKNDNWMEEEEWLQKLADPASPPSSQQEANNQHNEIQG